VIGRGNFLRARDLASYVRSRLEQLEGLLREECDAPGAVAWFDRAREDLAVARGAVRAVEGRISDRLAWIPPAGPEDREVARDRTCRCQHGYASHFIVDGEVNEPCGIVGCDCIDFNPLFDDQDSGHGPGFDTDGAH
jgi:hypothetical protein